MNPYQQNLRDVNLPDLSVLYGANILVTGSTGLIGSCLTELLTIYAEEYGYEVYAGCRNVERARSKFSPSEHLHYVLIDVTVPLQCDIKFDYIIDAASNGSPNFFASDPVGVMKANLMGVCNLLDYGIDHGLKRLVYISSGEVYGEGCGDRWRETDSGYINTMSQRACYPSSKRAAETLCVAYAEQYGIDISVARLCHTYGPNFTESDNRVYAQFIRNVLNGDDIVLKSKGEQYRSWLYVVDCAAALIYVLVKGENKAAYNVADEQSNITIRELAETIASIVDKTVIFDLPQVQPTVETPITKAVFDTTKLMALGWNATYPIEMGIKNTIETLLE